MARPGFKPGWGRHPFPGRFDSRCLPPFSKISQPPKSPVGAGLPAKTAAHSTSQCLTDRFRGQARSHRNRCHTQIFCPTQNPVGAGLPAKTVCQSTSMLTDRPLSSERRPEQAAPTEAVIASHNARVPVPVAGTARYRRAAPKAGVPRRARPARRTNRSTNCLDSVGLRRTSFEGPG